MTTEYTPGPWEVDPDSPYQISSFQWGGIGFVHNEPAENEALMEIARANARLIAAAPELLEVAHQLAELGDVSEVWAAVKSQVGEGPFIKARAAVAKAEGRTD